MAGIDEWLTGLATLLNEMLRTSLRIKRDPVWLGPGPGEPPEPGPVGLRLTLVALHASPPARNAPRAAPGAAGPARAAGAAPFLLDAHLMLTAVSEPRLYAEAIKFLSLAMRWLHDHPILSPADLQLDAPGTLAIELADLPLDQLAALLGAYPTGGAPFAIYRVRGMVVGAGPEAGTAILMD